MKEIRTPAEDRIHGRKAGLPPIREGATREEGGWMHAARGFLAWRLRGPWNGAFVANDSSRKGPLHAGLAAARNAAKKKPAYLPAFFSFLAARFSLSDFSGFFFSVFFWSMPLLIGTPLVGGRLDEPTPPRRALECPVACNVKLRPCH
jgi:hypothetical protein